MIRWLFSLSVTQPLVVVFAIAVASALGVHLVSDLPIEAFPDVQDVQVQVITQSPGQAPEEVERAISQPIERELAGTPRAIRIRSVSITGLSVVTVTFSDGTNDFFARQQINERLGNVTLPEGVQAELAPLSNAVGEIYRYVLEAPQGMSESEVRSIQDWFVRPRLKTVPGVADVVSFGGAVGELQVRVDPIRLARHGLTLADVERAAGSGGGNVGAGVLKRGDQSFVIRGIGLYRTPQDVAQSVITVRNGTPVRLEDVAEIGFGEKPRSGIVGLSRREQKTGNGAPVVTDHDRVVEGIVQMLKGGNASNVVAAVAARVDAINEQLQRDHPGVRLVTIYQRTDLIAHTVSTVAENLILGASLVLVILWLFLRRILVSLVVAAVIPLALLVAFVGMRLLDVPANLMSLGAVDFGIIIDSAVVLVEALMVSLAIDARAGGAADAVQRHATLEKVGARLVGPILFSKAIIICAFLPIFGFQRVEGRIFTPVALTLSLALLGGLALTLTLVPALLSRLLARATIEEVHLGWMTRLSAGYQRLLARVFERPRRSMAVAFTALALTLAGAPMLGTEFLPKLDEGNIWLTLGIAPSASLDMTKSIERDLRQALLEFPEVRQVITQVGRPDDGTDPKGPNNLEVLADLVSRGQWRFPDKESLIAAMSERVHRIPGITTNFSQVIQDNVEEALSGAKGEVVVKAYGPELDVLDAKGRQIADAIGRVRGAVDVAALPIVGQTEADVNWRRDQLARYGLSAGDANRALATAFGGNVVGTFFDGERKLDVTVRFASRDRTSLDDLAALPVAVPQPSADGAPATVPLASLATITERIGASRITREAGERHVTVKSNISDRDLGSFVAEARATVAREVVVPAGYRLEWGGQFENQQRAMKRLATIVPLALVAILALLFLALRAWRPAILVLTVLPFALIGGFAGMALAGLHLSVSAAVGFIAVVGIAVQNSLIMVEQCLENLAQLRHQPQAIDGPASTGVHDAIVAAAGSRLRPILMTALMAGLGLLPAALSHGIGAETQRPFAVVIVGGVISATIATLLLLPLLTERMLGSKARVAELSPMAGPDAHPLAERPAR